MKSFMDGITNCLKFSSRMSRRTFVLFHLQYLLIMLALAFIAGIAGSTPVLMPLFTLISICMVLPAVTSAIRRLHDMGRTGWWLLLTLIPLVGLIFMIWISVAKGTEGENDWGEPHVLE